MTTPGPVIVARDLPAAKNRPGLGRPGLLARALGVVRTTRLWRLLPALVPPLLFLPVVLAPPLNHDVAAVLQFSQRWFAGEHLYTDLIDVNPPLIFVLNLLPAAIAEWTPIEATLALQLCLLALGAVCWWLAMRVRDRAGEGPVLRSFLDVAPLLVLLGAGYDFGQREHIMAVTALPWLLLAARRARGDRLPTGRRIAIGLLAGVGFALKPHFLAVPALVEIFVIAMRMPEGWGLAAWGVALRRSLRDPAPWAMAAVWVAYLASLPLVFPDYLGSVVPLVWDFYLDQGGLSAWQVLLVPRLATVICLLLPLLWLSLRQRHPSMLARLLALAALGALVSAMAQHKGWSYHIVPIELFAGCLACVLAASWFDRMGATAPAPGKIVAGLVALVMLYGLSNGEAPWKELDYANSQVAQLADVLNQEAAGERVLVLSPGISPIFPALNYAHVKATLRTMNMWLLEGAYQECLPDGRRYRDVWEMGRAEFFVYRTVAEDFARAPPAMVVVDRDAGIPWCGAPFDFVAYFRRHPLFAEMWSHYKLVAEWDRYKAYARKD